MIFLNLQRNNSSVVKLNVPNCTLLAPPGALEYSQI